MLTHHLKDCRSRLGAPRHARSYESTQGNAIDIAAECRWRTVHELASVGEGEAPQSRWSSAGATGWFGSGRWWRWGWRQGRRRNRFGSWRWIRRRRYGWNRRCSCLRRHRCGWGRMGKRICLSFRRRLSAGHYLGSACRFAFPNDLPPVGRGDEDQALTTTCADRDQRDNGDGHSLRRDGVDSGQDDAVQTGENMLLFQSRRRNADSHDT